MVISKVKRYFDHFEALRGTLVILLVLGCILVNLEVYEYLGFGLYFGYFRSLWVFRSFPNFDGGILVILEALVVIIGYLVDFINIWDIDMHPSCTKFIFKVWLLYWKSGVRYWFWRILSLIKWLDCVNKVNHSFLLGGYNDTWITLISKKY